MFFSYGSPLKLGIGATLLAVGMGTQLSKMPLRSAATTVALENHQPAAVPNPYGPRRFTGSRTVTIEADRYGQFQADVEIEGRVLPMMVDTGATAVSLSWDDAVRMGVQPGPHQFTVRLRTANGIVRAAKVRLPEVRVSGIVVRDVIAVVSPPGHETPNLLGMTFLNGLRHFQVSDGKLVLEQ